MTGLDATPDLRWLRAVAVAFIAATIGVVAHVSAGGLMPGVGVLVVVVAGLVVLSAAALGRPASYAALAVLVGGGQMVVHLVLTAVSGHSGPHPAMPSATVAPLPTGGVRDDLAVATGTAAPEVSAAAGTPHWFEHLRDDLTGPNLVMALAHLAAAAGVAGWLFVGERSLWTLVALLGAHVTLRLARRWWLTPLGAGPRREVLTTRPAVGPAVARLRRTAANGSTGRRGPPGEPRVSLLTPTI